MINSVLQKALPRPDKVTFNGKDKVKCTMDKVQDFARVARL